MLRPYRGPSFNGFGAGQEYLGDLTRNSPCSLAYDTGSPPSVPSLRYLLSTFRGTGTQYVRESLCACGWAASYYRSTKGHRCDVKHPGRIFAREGNDRQPEMPA